MWLGQFYASPTCAHFLAAKHVLHYLAGIRLLVLCLGSSSPCVPSTLSSYLQNVSCSDADWASDTVGEVFLGTPFIFPGLSCLLVCCQAKVDCAVVHPS